MDVLEVIKENNSVINLCINKYYIALKRLGYEKEDMQQIAYIAIIENINKYNNNKSSLKTFVFNCIKYKFLNTIRDCNFYPAKTRESRFDSRFFSSTYISNDWYKYEKDTFNINEKIILFDLYNAINKLNIEEKNIIEKLYFKEKTQNALAKELKTSQVQISRKNKKVLQKLKKYLGDDYTCK